MISARRLAREWALKVLYQADIGKMPIEESMKAALERLRMEFVQRSSRAATGSFLEHAMTDAVTAKLVDLLPRFGAGIEVALRACFEQIADAASYWRSLDTSFTFSRQSYNGLWVLPHGWEGVELPTKSVALPESVVTSAAVSDIDRAMLREFMTWSQGGLSLAVMESYAKEVRSGRPEGVKLQGTHEFVVARWRDFGSVTAERWRTAVGDVQRETCDWMRVASFTRRLVTGVFDHREELDSSLQTLEIGWSAHRQVSVDRNILLMAAFELAHIEGVPVSATINEAVELAKKYSTAESGKFVNGVLGAIVARSSGVLSPLLADEQETEGLDTITELESDTEELVADQELAPA